MEFGVTIAPLSTPVWDKDGLTKAVAAKLEEYTNIVYSEDNIKTAKADRAELNKVAKMIEDERKRVKVFYNAPYAVFEKEVKEIVGMIDKTVQAIDVQVKTFEAKARQEKLDAVKALYDERDFKGVAFEVIQSPKWTLASTSLASVAAEMDRIAGEIAADFAVLEALDEYQYEAIQTYKATWSLSDAMRTVNTLKETARRKAEYERQKEEERQRALAAAQEVPADTKLDDEVPDLDKYEVKYTDDGMPDFDAIGGQHAVVIKAKVTDAEETKIRAYLEQLAVEFTIIYGG